MPASELVAGVLVLLFLSLLLLVAGLVTDTGGTPEQTLPPLAPPLLLFLAAVLRPLCVSSKGVVVVAAGEAAGVAEGCIAIYGQATLASTAK